MSLPPSRKENPDFPSSLAFMDTGIDLNFNPLKDAAETAWNHRGHMSGIAFIGVKSLFDINGAPAQQSFEELRTQILLVGVALGVIGGLTELAESKIRGDNHPNFYQVISNIGAGTSLGISGVIVKESYADNDIPLTIVSGLSSLFCIGYVLATKLRVGERISQGVASFKSSNAEQNAQYHMEQVIRKAIAGDGYAWRELIEKAGSRKAALKIMDEYQKINSAKR